MPRVSQFWYKYTYMEEMLGNIAGMKKEDIIFIIINLVMILNNFFLVSTLRLSTSFRKMDGMAPGRASLADVYQF